MTPARSAAPGPYAGGQYDLTCNNISDTFSKFMKCNAGSLGTRVCQRDFASQYFVFDNVTTVEQLRRHHVIMLPGGDFDFFNSLVLQCDNQTPGDLQLFYLLYPKLAGIIRATIEKDVCPDYRQGLNTYYDKFMNAFSAYEQFLNWYDIPFTRLQFSMENMPQFIGDRAGKVTLLADTIDAIESGPGRPETYILLGHSYGGLNIMDFLMELLEAHVPGTPEYRLFQDTAVRAWPREKKQLIYGKIRAVAFINSFLQGSLKANAWLEQIAKEQGVTVEDPVTYYINRVLTECPTATAGDDNQTRSRIYHSVLRCSTYRQQYYFLDKNSAQPISGNPVGGAISRIANEKAVLCAGSVVPKLLPDIRVQPNVLVFLSRRLWRLVDTFNDGLVETQATILPRGNVEYIGMKDLDHGGLVLKPKVRGISIAYDYNQRPFILTLFARLISKVEEIPGATDPL